MIDPFAIEQGELLLARTGISHCLTASKAPLWIRKTATPIEDQIRTLAREFVAGARAPAKVTLPAFNYEQVLDQLIAFKEPEAAAFAKLDHETITDYLVVLHRAVQYLSKVIPKSAIKDMVGVRNVSPSDLKLSKFRRIYGVAEDPLSALRALVSGMLVKDQAVALQTMFPQIFEATKTAIFDEFAEKRTGNLEWTLTFAADRALQTFLLTTPDNKAAVKQLQKNFADATERKGEEMKEAAASPAKGMAKSIETSVQRASQ